jgi:hypothetical protein
MSEEDRDDIKERSGQISRRTFLKDAGLAVGAPTLGSIAVSSEAAAQGKKVPPSQAAARPAAGTVSLIAIEMTVNGGKYQCNVEPHWTLRQVLRDMVGFTSPKDLCGGQGACG